MKKSEAQVAHGKPATTQQSTGAKLEAPIQLTLEQLETAAGGFARQLSNMGSMGTITTGAYTPSKPLKLT